MAKEAQVNGLQNDQKMASQKKVDMRASKASLEVYSIPKRMTVQKDNGTKGWCMHVVERTSVYSNFTLPSCSLLWPAPSFWLFLHRPSFPKNGFQRSLYFWALKDFQPLEK